MTQPVKADPVGYPCVVCRFVYDFGPKATEAQVLEVKRDLEGHCPRCWVTRSHASSVAARRRVDPSRAAAKRRRRELAQADDGDV